MTVPLVFLDRALARDRKVSLVPLSISLGPGVHAIVGTPADGTHAAALLLSGQEAPRAGAVLVAGRAPSRDPALRARIGAALDTPSLPELGTVSALVALVARLRGGPAEGVLERFGVGALAGRRVGGLSPPEARAVDLALALSLEDPALLVLVEPFADATGIDRARVDEALGAAAARGAAAVVLTASLADATSLGGTTHLLDRGRLVRSLAGDEAALLAPGAGVELRIVADEPRALVRALSSDEAIGAVAWDAARDPSLVTIRGTDPEAAALALARAARATGTSVRSIAPVVPGLDEVRAAAAGMATAAWHAAYRATAARMAPPTPAPAPAPTDLEGGGA